MGRKPQANNEVQVHLKPRTEAQRIALDLYAKNDVVFFLGPAGTGKTLLAVYCALYDKVKTFSTRRVDKVIITRPIVSAGEELGFLPGEMEQKVHPYMLPIFDCVAKLTHLPEEYAFSSFEIAPLAYMRGRTFSNCVAILDEAQNCTMPQLKLFLSRMGEGCKLIITGDPQQSDIGRKSGLNKAVNALRDIESIGAITFTKADIVRNPLVAKMLEALPD